MASFQFTQTPPFQPTQVSGCTLWLDAANTASFTLSGSTVTQWTDRVSNTAFTSAGSPTYPSTAQNNYNTIALNGTSQYFSSSFTVDSANHTLIAVHKPTNTTTANTSLFRFQTAGTPYIVFPYRGASNRGYITSYDGTPINFQNSTLLDNSVSTNFNLLVGTIASGAQATFLNGTSQATTAEVLTSSTSPSLFIGGYVLSGTAYEFYGGNIGEILIYNVSLSTSQRQIIEGYLAWKWGINSLLPNSHPYKNTPPYVLPPFPLAPQVKQFSSILTYNPTNIPNCILWLDGADLSQMFTDTGGTTPITASGQSVKCWKDKSSSANNATNNTNPPTVTFQAQNNRSVLNFSSQYLDLDVNKLPTSSTPFTFFIIFRTTSTSTQVYMSWGNTTNAGGFGRAPQFYITNYTLANDLYGSAGPSDNTTYNSVYILNSVTASATVYSAWDNGNPFSGGTVNITLQTGTAFAYLGVGQVNNALNTGFYLSGQIAEVIGYNRVLSTTERQQVEGYLQWKWGIQSTIPSGNPYNVTPPYSTSPFPLVPRVTFISGKYFNPNSISDSSLWLDSADVSQFTLSGSTITAVTDKSSTPKTITITNTVSYTLREAIVFTDTNGRFTLAAMPAAPYDYIFVGTANSSSATWRTMLRTGSTPGTHPFLLESGTNNAGMWDSTAFQQFGSLIQAISEKAMFYGSMASNRTITASKNGTISLTAASPAGNESILTTVGNSIAGLQPYGQLHELIIYSRTLSLFQRQQVEGYLAWKWGLQSNLPSSHPFKLFPPPP